MKHFFSRARQEITAMLADSKWTKEPHHMTVRAGNAEMSLEWMKALIAIVGKHDKEIYKHVDKLLASGHPEKAHEALSSHLGPDKITDLLWAKFILNRFVRFIPTKDTTPGEAMNKEETT